MCDTSIHVCYKCLGELKIGEYKYFDTSWGGIWVRIRICNKCL